jgi:hypothetical protein
MVAVSAILVFAIAAHAWWLLPNHDSAGLQVADTSFYYPGDRGISESVRLGREMAGDIM